MRHASQAGTDGGAHVTPTHRTGQRAEKAHPGWAWAGSGVPARHIRPEFFENLISKLAYPRAARWADAKVVEFNVRHGVADGVQPFLVSGGLSHQDGNRIGLCSKDGHRHAGHGNCRRSIAVKGQPAKALLALFEVGPRPW